MHRISKPGRVGPTGRPLYHYIGTSRLDVCMAPKCCLSLRRIIRLFAMIRAESWTEKSLQHFFVEANTSNDYSLPIIPSAYIIRPVFTFSGSDECAALHLNIQGSSSPLTRLYTQSSILRRSTGTSCARCAEPIILIRHPEYPARN